MEEGNRVLKGLTPTINCTGLEVWLLLITHWPEQDTQPHLTTRGQEGATLPLAWKQGNGEFGNCQQGPWDSPFLLSLPSPPGPMRPHSPAASPAGL